MFARREEWWDLLGVLDQGRCFLPGEKRGGAEEGGEEGGREGGRGPAPEWLEGEALSSEMDAVFMARVQATVAAAAAAAAATTGGGGREGGIGGEDYLRGVFQAHTQSLLDLALDGATQTKNSRAREVVRKLALANSYRIQALRRRVGSQVRGRGAGREGGRE